MHCVKNSVIKEDTIKKSRFISRVIPCLTEEQALQQLNQLHQQYPTASHIVYAYRINSVKGIINRCHDAGEPSGTAGKPVFQHLEAQDLVNVLVAVVRYFGGVKLGAGGLTRAYSNSAKSAIEACTLIEYIEYQELELEIDYKQLQNFEYQLAKLDGVIVKQDFSERINLVVKIPEKQVDALKAIFETMKRGA